MPILGFVAGTPQRLTARGYLEDLVRRAPDDASAHHDLGTVYLQTRDFPKSIESLRESLRLRPDHPPTLLNLGFALKDNGQCDEAIATMFRILQVAPYHACAVQAKHELDQIRPFTERSTPEGGLDDEVLTGGKRN